MKSKKTGWELAEEMAKAIEEAHRRRGEEIDKLLMELWCGDRE
jgi:hypothetical protein